MSARYTAPDKETPAPGDMGAGAASGGSQGGLEGGVPARRYFRVAQGTPQGKDYATCLYKR